MSRATATAPNLPKNPHHRFPRVAMMRIRSSLDKPLDVFSRWASTNLDMASLVLFPALYAFTVVYAFALHAK